ncbi:MAG: N-acetylmuramoyl-L-alanine amidase [Candidatus Omnitrophota bacterium]
MILCQDPFKPAGGKTTARGRTLLLVCLLLTVIFYSGCAGVPRKEKAAVCRISGVDYVPLVSVCAPAGVRTEYDAFSGKARLFKNNHEVVLRTLDDVMLFDGELRHLTRPLQVYRGSPVIAYCCVDQLLSSFGPPGTVTTEKKPVFHGIKKVVIDAGHGGYDPGALGRNGLKEKIVTLDMAKRLAAIMRGAGVQVVMTRSIDVFVPLEQRVKIANESGADLFISVHINASRQRSLNGFEVYYVSPQVNDYKRAKEAAGEYSLRLREGDDPQIPYEAKRILWDMFYCYSRAESTVLAGHICSRIGVETQMKVLGVKNARFHVLRGANMPAVLIEAGFLSNPSEEAQLKNSRYRQKLAECIARGLESYTVETTACSE